ncbi:MAG: hypothetical protein B7X55_11080 [Rhodobacterales bacterium 34-62-10]|nr:MAG: hypothetical protein B7X55_11080 [Rhodobacterales bacterium 34-62-10]
MSFVIGGISSPGWWQQPDLTGTSPMTTSATTYTTPWGTIVIERIVKVSGSPQIPDDGDQRLRLIIDEFPLLKHMPSLLKVPETHRSKGVSLVQTAQSLSQIYEHIAQRMKLPPADGGLGDVCGVDCYTAAIRSAAYGCGRS